MARKTFDVDMFVDQSNTMLQHSPEDKVGFRTGIIRSTEQVLHATGNYNGFRYLSPDEVEDGNPGVRSSMSDRYVMHSGKTTDEYDIAHTDTWFVDTDETRRQYY